jgi:hypothetical protein
MSLLVVLGHREQAEVFCTWGKVVTFAFPFHRFKYDDIVNFIYAYLIYMCSRNVVFCFKTMTMIKSTKHNISKLHGIPEYCKELF